MILDEEIYKECFINDNGKKTFDHVKFIQIILGTRIVVTSGFNSQIEVKQDGDIIKFQPTSSNNDITFYFIF